MPNEEMLPAGRLTVLETHRVLRIARGGRLQRWLGPALRGLAGGRLRARVCRQPVASQVCGGAWEQCKGCPLMRGCAYGETVEGGPPEAAPRRSPPDRPRPLVVAPAFPCPQVGRVGDHIPVRVAFLGPTAAGHAAAFWEALRVGGADPGLGLGEDRVLFDVLPGECPDHTEEVVVPLDPMAVPGVVPRVRVVLTGPLVLKPWVGLTRRLIERPTLADLLARWEALAPFFGDGGSPLPASALERVKAAAALVPTLAAEFEVFGQVKSSHRSGDRWEVQGVVGWADYGPLPAGLLPWLRWAGRLHVGTHRVAGAGGWDVEAA